MQIHELIKQQNKKKKGKKAQIKFTNICKEKNQIKFIL
jgi:hypothetical protein